MKFGLENDLIVSLNCIADFMWSQMRASNFLWVDEIVLSYRTNQVYNGLQVLHLILSKLLHWNCQDSITAMVFVLNFTCSIWLRPWCSYSIFITLQDQSYGGSQTTTKYSSTSIDAIVKGYLDQILILTIVSSSWYSTSSWRIEFHYSGMVNLVEMYHGHVFSPQSVKKWDWIVRMEIKLILAHLFGKLWQLGFLSLDCNPSDGNASFMHIMYLLH
jgi:hypothetical protein